MAKSNAARRITSDTPQRAVKPANAAEHSTSSSIATSLDRLLHDRMRLGIVSALAAGDELSFTDLKSALNATDGNLSVHARKLEEAGYVVCTKTFEGRVPRTDYRLSDAGRRALERYLSHMEGLIRATRER